jgi:hypothetical protein
MYAQCFSDNECAREIESQVGEYSRQHPENLGEGADTLHHCLRDMTSMMICSSFQEYVLEDELSSFGDFIKAQAGAKCAEKLLSKAEKFTEQEFIKCAEFAGDTKIDASGKMAYVNCRADRVTAELRYLHNAKICMQCGYHPSASTSLTGSGCKLRAPAIGENVTIRMTEDIPPTGIGKLNPMPESMRAILAMYSLQDGTGCNQRDEAGLHCELTTALGLGTQCSERHIGLVRSWFRNGIPSFSASASVYAKDTQKPGGLETICYHSPGGASVQSSWSTIHININKNIVTIEAEGSWIAHEDSGGAVFRSRYEIGIDSISVIDNSLIRSWRDPVEGSD